MKIASVVVLCFLCGCSAVESLAKKNDESTNTVRQESPRAETVPIVTLQDPEVCKEIGELRAESQASNNATKNEITGMGVQVTKVAEKMQLFGGDLLRLQDLFKLEMNNTLKAHVEMNNDVRAEIKNAMTVHATAMASAMAEFSAKVNAEFKAVATGQAAVNARMDTFTQTVSAGRDSNVRTTQFTDGMASLMKDDNRTQFWTVVTFSFLIFLLQERSRHRAEARFTEFKHKVLERSHHEGK